MIIFVYALDPDGSVFNEVSRATEYSALWIPLGMLLLTLISKNRKKTSQCTWYTLTWLQYIRWLCLINTSLDDNLQFFFQSLIKGTNGEKIFPSYTTEVFDKFQEMGIESCYFINNIEKFLIVFAANISLCIFIMIVACKSTRFNEYKEKFTANLAARTVLVCVYDFFLFSLLQFYNVNLSENYNFINSLIAAGIFIICMIVTIYCPIYTTNQSSCCLETTHQSTLLEEFKHKEKDKGFYYFIYLIIRFGSAICLVFMQSTFISQAAIIGLLELALILYIVLFKPFQDMNIGYCVVTCEICTLGIICCLLSYGFTINESGKLFLRWVIICCFWTAMIVCIGRFIVTFLKKYSEVEETKKKSEGSIVPIVEELQVETRIRDFSDARLGRKSENEISSLSFDAKAQDSVPLENKEEKVVNDENNERNNRDLNDSSIPLFFDESNVKSEIPYYSRLMSKFTKEIAEKNSEKK
ncbi:hypothetical protein SteCoe_38722 [Stentor coeruleus]|uniref:TRP C-terminal domain-containing protein n=1 Tax=Stentor coeruleus TaxID=5963 RepID=A0A1R2ALD5_9CILI|nr:hypothetical protein SteCoe_38722 [Stentor coeruleus]